MSKSLAISVRLHEGWYHGAGSIPSPARMFQALIAGHGLSGPLSTDAIEALEWLEQQEPPIVAAPVIRGGQSVATFVPNNDLDAKQGDFRRVGEIRTKKSIRPLLFDEEVPFMFCWSLKDDAQDSKILRICELADGVFQLGRAVDAGWAWAEMLSDDELFERLRNHRGPVLRPSTGQGNIECPTPGSLASLRRRYVDMSNRYAMTTDGNGQTFRRQAKPKWRMVSYGSAQTSVCFDLVDRESSTLANWPATRTMELVTMIRDGVVARLVKALPELETEINQTLVGRKPNGENAGPVSARTRILPLPSIGHEHSDEQIRRVLIQIPGECPIRAEDVLWGFSSQSLTLHGRSVDVLQAQPNRQLEHYGIATPRPSRVWQSVTPIALASAVRRRIEPDQRKRNEEDKKGSAERRFEQERATNALEQALRQGGITAKLSNIRLQREPFSARGQRADAFQTGDRFSKHSLWHAKLEFANSIAGPLVLGDGRFMGLGLFEPIESPEGVFAFAIESGLEKNPDPVRLGKSLRRAVMARVQTVLGSSNLPTYFSGHSSSNTPADSKLHPHLTYLFDPNEKRLLVLQPEIVDATIKRNQRHSKTLEFALDGFSQLLAGTDGCLQIRSIEIDQQNDPIFSRSTVWESVTPYCVNRHAKKTGVVEVIIYDVLQECERRNFSRPEVTVNNWNVASGKLQADLRLEFRQAISGPIILGKTRHHGGGFFSTLSKTRKC